MLQGVLVDEASEVLFHRAGDLARSPGAGAIHQSSRALGGNAMDPFAPRRLGQVKRIGDRLEALPCHDGTDRVGATEDTGLLGPLQEGLSGGEGGRSEVQFEGSHDDGLQNKRLQQ
jgi:hypothetical protein